MQWSFMLVGAGLAVSAGYAIRVQAITRSTRPKCANMTPDEGCAQELMFFGNADGEFIATVVVVGLSCILSLAWIVHQLRFRLPSLLRMCCTWLVDGDNLPSASSIGRDVLRKARLLCTKRAPDPDADKIRDEYERQRLWRVRSFASKSCPFFIAFLLFSTYVNFFERLERSHDLRRITWEYIFAKELVPLVITSTWTIIVDMKPSLVTPAVVDSLNVMLSAMWSWKLGTTLGRYYDYNKYWIIVGRIVEVAMLGNAPLTWLLNIMVFFADCMVMSAHGDLGGKETYREIIVVFLVCVLSYILDQLQWSEAKSTVLVQKSNHSAALVQQALSCMCDAVPKLDADLRLAEPCPSLSALLLRDGPLMPGVVFTDLMSAEDAQRLRTSIASQSRFQDTEEGAAAGRSRAAGEAATPNAFAGLCHVHLRGANNLALPASLFYSCVPDVNGQPTFLLGIRENHEEGQPPAASLGGAAANAAADPQVALTALPEASATESVPSSSSAWSTSELSTDQGDALCIWVDAASPGLHVLRCSLGFALLGGASGPCHDLSEWLSDADLSRLRAEVGPGASLSAEVLRVRLCPPVGGVYKCRVSLHAEQGSGAEVPPVRVVFHIMGFSGRRREAQRPEGAGGEAAHISASGRLGGSYRSSNVEALGRKSREASRMDVELTVQLGGGLPIGLLRGSEEELIVRFAEQRHLQEWLVDPVGFLDALIKSVRSSQSDTLTDAREVGTFDFQQPGPPSTSACFTARVSLLCVSDDASDAYPIRVGLRHLEWHRDAAIPAAQQAPRAPSVEPQLLGSASSLAL